MAVVAAADRDFRRDNREHVADHGGAVRSDVFLRVRSDPVRSREHEGDDRDSGSAAGRRRLYAVYGVREIRLYGIGATAVFLRQDDHDVAVPQSSRYGDDSALYDQGSAVGDMVLQSAILYAAVLDNRSVGRRGSNALRLCDIRKICGQGQCRVRCGGVGGMVLHAGAVCVRRAV